MEERQDDQSVSGKNQEDECTDCFVQGSIVNFDIGGRDETVIRGKTLLLPDSPLNFK